MAGRTDAGLFHVRPSLRISLAAGAAFLVLLALGSWQVQRLFWKSELIAQRQSRTAMAAIDLPAGTLDLDALEYRTVRLRGTFLHERELYLGARSLNGNVGYQVLTPMRLAEGRVVLVNRGWVPLDKKDPATRAEGQVAGEVTLEGYLRRPARQGAFQPDNRPDENFWFWIDLDAMSRALGLELEPFVVAAGPEPNPGGLPIGGQLRVDLPNDHLQYAITWYALAVILAVIFVLYHRRSTKPSAPED